MLLKLLNSVAVAILFSACCFAGTCPRELGAAAKTQAVLDKMAAPHDWRFIVVCSDSDWQFLLRHFGEQHTKALGATSLLNRTTWLKSDIFSTPSGETGYVHVILHEIGHIRCQCKSELVADKLATQMFEQFDQVTLAQKPPAAERVPSPEREPGEAAEKQPKLAEVSAQEHRKTCTAPTLLSPTNACAALSLK